MSYQGLKGGDRVTFWMQAGSGERKRRTAPVQRLLVFPTHVVVNLGGRFGTPYVVNDANFIAKAAA